jgi:hypothetical protein
MAARKHLLDLDEPVSFASTTPRVIRTTQVGKVIGFGCSTAEEEAFQSMEGFLKESRDNPGDQAEFESKLHDHVTELETQIAADQRARAGGG